MANITDLAVYLSTGRCIAWIGAGPSIEVGLPSWEELARIVLEECRRRPRSVLASIEDYYNQQKYPEMLDRVANSYGRPFLHDVSSAALKDHGTTGSIYSELVGMGFLSFFTTNYDRVLERHVEASGQVVKKYLNSDNDLFAVDVDTVPALVKLHGDICDPSSFIMTKTDYQHWYHSGQKEAYQTFIKSHLSRDRILFVGYSLTDPDLVAIQERLAVNLRRVVSSIAILPNVSDDDVDYWSTYYNVDVLGYRAVGSDHSELHSILATTSKVLALGEVAPIRRTSDDLKKLQALYLWHRFNRNRSGEAPVDALQSVILTLALDAGGSIDSINLIESLETEMGIAGPDMATDVEAALRQLTEAKWLEATDNYYRLPNKSQLTIGGYERRFTDMMSVFREQTIRDMARDEAIPEPAATDLVETAIDTLIDIFEIRGREIVQMAFGNTPLNDSSLLDLIETIWRRANRLDDSRLKFTLVRFVLDILSKPTGIYESVLNYLARAFFCIQALRIDSNVGKMVSEVVSDRALIIDANVLISLTAEHEERHEFIRRVVEAVRTSEMPLYATLSFLDEVRRHASWALQLAKDHGEQSIEVLNASRGQGGYDANAYLRGFIGWKAGQGERGSILDYLRSCFGGSFERSKFEEFFFNRYGIRIIEQSVINEMRASHKKSRDECLGKLEEWNAERRADHQKREPRMISEADAFILVTHWDSFSDRICEQKQKCTYLSLGSSLPRLARSSQTDKKMISISPQAIWEILDRLKSDDAVDGPDFRSLMLTSYFRLSSQFLDNTRYKSYFRPLIEESRRGYLEQREILEGILEMELKSDLLDEMPEEEWPILLRSLTETASKKASIDELRIAELGGQNEELRTLLEGYQEQERKRREYYRRERAKSRARRP